MPLGHDLFFQHSEPAFFIFALSIALDFRLATRVFDFTAW